MGKRAIYTLLLFLCAGLSADLYAQAPAGSTVIVNNGPSSVSRASKRPQGFNSSIPPLLLKAHTVFVSNAGSDAGLYPHPFSGTQDRAYGYFCDKIDDIDHFERVDVPGDADLVLEVSMLAPPGSVSGNKVSGTGDALPTFKLVVYDRPSHYILWTVSQTVDVARLQKTHDKNFDMSIDDVIKQFLAAATGRPLEAPKDAADAPK
jgi:hypothetical protein